MNSGFDIVGRVANPPAKQVCRLSEADLQENQIYGALVKKARATHSPKPKATMRALYYTARR